MTAYYNEIDPFMADWLRGLIGANLIAPGEVDERSIADVRADDLRGFTQCHFFAGAGIWSYGLRAAGWPDDRPIWTGSCPCQPYSQAGTRKGIEDARDLWPVWFDLIKEIRPAKIAGEQVASTEVVGTRLEDSFVVAVQRGDYARANKLAKQLFAVPSFSYTRRWIDRLQADLGAEDYALRFTVLGAHSAGAFNRRQRVIWMAYADSGRREKLDAPRREAEAERRARAESETVGRGTADGLADAEEVGRGPGRSSGEDAVGSIESGGCGAVRGVGNSEGQRHEWSQEGRRPAGDRLEQSSGACGLADPHLPGLEGHTGDEVRVGEPGRIEADTAGPSAPGGDDLDWLPCLDGKSRPVKSGIAPLAYGYPRNLAAVRARLEGMGFDAKSVRKLLREPRRIYQLARKYRAGVLHGYGNAVHGRVATEFCKVMMEMDVENEK